MPKDTQLEGEIAEILAYEKLRPAQSTQAGELGETGNQDDIRFIFIALPHHLACALTIFLSLVALANLGFIFFAIFRPAVPPSAPPRNATLFSHFKCVPNFLSRKFLILYPERFFIIVSPQVLKSPTKVSHSSLPTRASSFSHYVSPPTLW